MKRLQIRVLGSKHPPYRRQVRPGTRASDVLKSLNQDEDYELALASAPTNPFPEDADVHSLVRDGERLIARLSTAALQKRVAEADAFMEQIAFGEGDL